MSTNTIVDALRREVDFGVEELGDQGAQRIPLGQRGQLVAELKVIKNVLDIGGEAIQVVLEVGEQLLLTATGLQIAQGELGGVVKSLPGGVAQRGPLLGDLRRVEHRLRVHHLLFGGLEHRVHPPDDAHRQDHIRVLAALEQVAEDVVGDAPDEGDDRVVGGLIHQLVISFVLEGVEGCHLRQSALIFAAALGWRHTGVASG